MIPLGVLLFQLGADLAADAQVFTIYALAFSAGTFICIAASDVLPELQFHKHDRVAMTVMLVLGLLISIMVYAAIYHGLLSVGTMLSNPLGSHFSDFPGSFYQHVIKAECRDDQMRAKIFDEHSIVPEPNRADLAGPRIVQKGRGRVGQRWRWRRQPGESLARGAVRGRRALVRPGAR